MTADSRTRGTGPWMDLRVKTPAFRFLWAKYCKGFDESQHCYKCLIGDKVPLIPYGSVRAGIEYHGEVPHAPAPFLYLCGVTDTYSRNLHVAMRRDPDGLVELDTQDVELTVRGWTQVEIHALPEEIAATLKWDFRRCRNFQFAWEYLRSLPDTPLRLLPTQGALGL